MFFELKNKLEKNGFIIDNNNYDLAIVVGGDGAFLRLVNECNYNDNVYYVGINTGTLGFSNDIIPKKIDDFINDLRNFNFKTEYIDVIETSVYSNNNKQVYYSLNEIIIRQADLCTLKLNVFVDDEKLENFFGDGILICTNFGSTAYNRSLGGSIIHSDLNVIELTPVAPVNNKCYKSLNNSIILPIDKTIKFKTNDKVIISIDGRNSVFNKIDKVEFNVNKKLKLLRNKNFDYIKLINDKICN